MTELSENILSLREQGMSYNQIVSELGCSKGTVSYYLGKGQKEKTLGRQRKSRKSDPNRCIRKVEGFRVEAVRGKVTAFHRTGSGPSKGYPGPGNYLFTFQDVLEKFGRYTSCYLTGEKIDLLLPGTYEFDHVVPRYLGGDNSLENLGIATPSANKAKSKLSLEEFVSLCGRVTEVHGKN